MMFIFHMIMGKLLTNELKYLLDEKQMKGDEKNEVNFCGNIKFVEHVYE